MNTSTSQSTNRASTLFSAFGIGLTLAMSSAALAIGPQVIYTKIPTDPSSIIPGAVDSAGNPAVTNFRALENLYLSPDGSKWVISARTQQGVDNETILLMGSGLSGTMFLQEGRPVPAGARGEIIDFFGSGIGRFDDNNNFAFSLRARGGVASVFQKVLYWNGSTFTMAIQMGDLYTGLQDLSPNPSGDETVGNSIGSIHPLNNGTIGSQDSTILQIHSSRRPAIAYNHAGFKQTGVSTFLSMDGSINHIYSTLGANTFYTTPDGSRWLVVGRILGAPTTSDDVLIVDGQVKLQEGVAIGASSAVISTIVNTDLVSSGDWYSRGLRAGSGVWAAHNGTLLAQTGDSIIPASTEHWANTFYAFSGNGLGQYVLVGRTDSSDPAADDVVVVNGTVVLRENDPIDLNNNGLYDDNVFIGRGVNTNGAFEPNDVALTNDGKLYIFVNLRDGQGNDLNSNPAFVSPQAFIRLDVAPACIGDATGNHVVNIDDLVLVITNWNATGGPADLNGDHIVNIDDLVLVITHWGACP